MRIRLAALLGDLEVEDPEIDAEEIIADAFVIVRTFRPERDHPLTAYASTDGMSDDAVRLGTLQIVTDHIRDSTKAGWAE